MGNTITYTTITTSMTDLLSKMILIQLSKKKDEPAMHIINDFREYLPEPRNQGRCGSCWAFAAVSVLEAAYAKVSGGVITNFSEQYLVNCDNYDKGCNGGFPTSTLRWIQSNGVIERSIIPYEAKKEDCDTSLKSKQYKILQRWRYYYVNTGRSRQESWDDLQKEGPIIVAMNASFSGFQQYRPSSLIPVVAPSECGNVNHAVVVVGSYKDEEGEDFLLVRNSWGTGWGYKGNFTIKKSQSCKITDWAFITNVLSGNKPEN